MDWAQLGGQLAQAGLPFLGNLLGGPLGGAVGGVVGRSIAAALGQPETATPAQIAEVIRSNPDETRVRLRELELEASSKASAEETRRIELQLADVASARSQTTTLAQAGSSIAWGAPVMSALAILCFVVYTVALFFITVDIPDKLFSLLNAGYGANLIWVGAAMNYWLGSSAGSKQNAEVIRGIVSGATVRSTETISQVTPSKR